MPFSVEHCAEENMILVNIWGRTALAELKEAIEEIIRVVQVTQCRLVLTDLQKADWGLTMSETYHLPEMLARVSSETADIHLFKRAFVASENSEILRFYETVSQNRGQTTRMFRDADSAKEWLNKK